MERPTANIDPPQPAVEQPLHRREKIVQRHIPHRHVERGETELALERTPARRLDIDHAMREVFIAVKLIRQFHAVELWKLRRDDLRQRPRAAQKLLTQIAECEVRFARDDEVAVANAL